MLERLLRRLGYFSESEAIRTFKPEPGAYQFYCQYFGPEDIVVEAGAYQGFTTIGLLVNIAKFVYAFEPNPENFRHLEKNSRGLESRLRVFNMGLGSREEIAEIRGTGSESGFLRDKTVSSMGKAKIVPLDSLGLDPSPTVLIVDCEGMEADMIMGAQGTISKSVRAMMVETHKGSKPEVENLLSRLGFTEILTRESGWSKVGAYHDTWLLARRNPPVGDVADH